MSVIRLLIFLACAFLFANATENSSNSIQPGTEKMEPINLKINSTISDLNATTKVEKNLCDQEEIFVSISSEENIETNILENSSATAFSCQLAAICIALGTLLII